MNKKEWDKFCENKYAKKIRTAYDEDPKFAIGDCVQIRATNKVAQANYNRYQPEEHFVAPNVVVNRKLADKFGFVLEVNSKPITRAARGSKIYRVLLTGEPTPIYAHESDLKSPRKKRSVN